MAHSGINVLFEGSNFARLMGGLWTAVWIAAISLIIGLALGTIFGLLRTLKSRCLCVQYNIVEFCCTWNFSELFQRLCYCSWFTTFCHVNLMSICQLLGWPF